MYNRIKEWINKNTDFELINTEEIRRWNWQTKFDLIDNEGYKYQSKFNNLSAGKKPQRFHIHNKFTIDNIKLKVSQSGYSVISSKYINSKTKLKFQCPLGHIFEKNWNHWNSVPSCSVCNPAPNKTHDEFVEEVKELKGDEYSVIGKYINSKTKVLMKHNKCGNEWLIYPNSFLSGVGCNRDKCFRKYGAENHRYNPNLTDEERLAKRDVTELIHWRTSVFERYNYKCIICDKDTHNNTAHHLNGYNWDIENRFNVYNGVCMCEEHHKQFHSEYGYGDNTIEQFEEYCNKIILSRANESQ